MLSPPRFIKETTHFHTDNDDSEKDNEDDFTNEREETFQLMQGFFIENCQNFIECDDDNKSDSESNELNNYTLSNDLKNYRQQNDFKDNGPFTGEFENDETPSDVEDQLSSTELYDLGTEKDFTPRLNKSNNHAHTKPAPEGNNYTEKACTKEFKLPAVKQTDTKDKKSRGKSLREECHNLPAINASRNTKNLISKTDSQLEQLGYECSIANRNDVTESKSQIDFKDSNNSGKSSFFQYARSEKIKLKFITSTITEMSKRRKRSGASAAAMIEKENSNIPPHVQEIIDRNRCRDELYEANWRRGLDAFNDIGGTVQATREQIKALKAMPHIMDIIHRKRSEWTLGNRDGSSSGSVRGKRPRPVLFTKKGKLADVVAALIDYTHRPPPGARRMQRRNALLGLDKICFDVNIHIDGSCPNFVHEGYRRAAESIRFNVPCDLSMFQKLTPLQYLARHTRVDRVMRTSYTKRFTIFKKRVAALNLEDNEPTRRQVEKLQDGLFYAINHAFFNTIWRVNFALVDSLVMAGEKYHRMTVHEFIGVCAITERCYWRMFDSVNDDRDEELGCRERLEHLDFKLVERRQEEFDLPVRMKILIRSLS